MLYPFRLAATGDETATLALVERLWLTNGSARWRVEREIMSNGPKALPSLLWLLESCEEEQRPHLERLILLTLCVSEESKIPVEILHEARAIAEARFGKASEGVPEKSDIGGERYSTPHREFPWVRVYSYKTSRYPSGHLVDGAASTVVRTSDLPNRFSEWVILAGIRLDTPDSVKQVVRTFVGLVGGAYDTTANGEIEVTKIEEGFEARCSYQQTVPSGCFKDGAALAKRVCAATRVSRLQLTMNAAGDFAILVESDPITACDCTRNRR
jgi:hypothetical protein